MNAPFGPSGLPESRPPLPGRSRTPGPPWTGRDLALAVGLLLVGYAAVIIAVSAVAATTDPETDPNAALALAIATFAFSIWLGAIVLILASRRNFTLTELGFRRLRGAGLLWPLATWGAGIGIIVLYGVAVLVVQEVTGRDLSRLTEGNPIPDSEASTDLVWAVLGVSVILAAPFGEELFFRGLLFRAMQARWGLIPGMAVSGLLFAFVHFEVSVVVPFWGIGMLFAWAYHRSGSLWTPVGAHAIFNGVSFAATLAGVAS